MNDIIKLVIKYKNQNNDLYFEEIINKFKPLISFYIKKVSLFYRDDLYQEILITIYKIIMNFQINNFNEDLLLDFLLDKNIKDLSNKEIKYILQFINNYKKDSISSENKEMIIKEFNLFNNQNQFILNIKKGILSTYINYINSTYFKYSKNKVSINKLSDLNDEGLDFIIDDSTIYKSTLLDNLNLNKSEISFINAFIERGQVLSEKEVGKKLGISQQCVNKRKKQIIEKYKNSSS